MLALGSGGVLAKQAHDSHLSKYIGSGLSDMMVWSSSEKKDDEEKSEADESGKGRKLPSGFERLLRRTKKGINHKESAEKESASKKEDDSKADESDAEESAKDSEEDTKKKKASEGADAKSTDWKSYFINPNGGGPEWENIGLAALIAGTLVYYMGF